MWQKQRGATKSRPLAKILAEERGWAATDDRAAFLDSVWKAAVDIANAPHHPEGQQGEQRFDVQDARLMLVLTAALCEYLSP